MFKSFILKNESESRVVKFEWFDTDATEKFQENFLEFSNKVFGKQYTEVEVKESKPTGTKPSKPSAHYIGEIYKGGGYIWGVKENGKEGWIKGDYAKPNKPAAETATEGTETASGATTESTDKPTTESKPRPEHTLGERKGKYVWGVKPNGKTGWVLADGEESTKPDTPAPVIEEMPVYETAGQLDKSDLADLLTKYITGGELKFEHQVQCEWSKKTVNFFGIVKKDGALCLKYQSPVDVTRVIIAPVKTTKGIKDSLMTEIYKAAIAQLESNWKAAHSA